MLKGRYAGRKAYVLKCMDNGTADKQFDHALVVGIDRYPRLVTQRMTKKKVRKNTRIKTFIQVSLVRIQNHPC